LNSFLWGDEIATILLKKQLKRPLADFKKEAAVTIPNDPANGGRILLLLTVKNLVTFAAIVVAVGAGTLGLIIL